MRGRVVPGEDVLVSLADPSISRWERCPQNSQEPEAGDLIQWTGNEFPCLQVPNIKAKGDARAQ